MTETTDVRTDSSATDVTADQRRTGESTDSAGGGGTNGAKTRRRPGLTGMVLADLQRIAGELGVAGTTRMRKSDLIAVIKERQNGGAPTNDTAAPHAPTAQSPTAQSPTAQPRTVQPSTTQLPATQLPT
ncbi:MAG: Rho termination factor N-terminal domain-containing protein, partial [Mycobacteriales bacterium]